MSDETQIQPVDLAVVVKGEVISDNFPEFKKFALSKMEGINLDLKTDDDFRQAKIDIADLKKFDEILHKVDREMIESMDKVNKLLTGTRELREVSGAKRKHLANLAKTRTAELKASLIKTGIEALEIKTHSFEKAVRESIARMSSLENMQLAITAKVQGINMRVFKNRDVISEFSEKHGSDICHGESALVLMSIDALSVELERRVERREADRKTETLRKETEELKAKANAAAREALEKLRAEEEAIKTSPPLVKASSENTETPLESTKEAAKPSLIGNKTSSPSESQEDELARYLNTVRSSLAPMRDARKALKHPENIEIAQAFADVLNAGFAQLKGGSK